MSFTSSKGKQYGLIIPAKKLAAKPLAKKCVFGDSSSDEVGCTISYGVLGGDENFHYFCLNWSNTSMKICAT